MPKAKAVPRAVLEYQLQAQIAQNEQLRAENVELSAKVDKLIDALVAKESPTAFGYAKAEEAEKRITPEERAEEQRRREEAKLLSRYTAELEDSSLFKNVDDMMNLLSRPLNKPGDVSLHGNSES